MPIILPDSITAPILAAVTPQRAEDYRSSLAANGARVEGGWEFPDCEAMQKAHDLFYPDGRPPGPQLVAMESKVVITTDAMLLQAAERSPICRECPRNVGLLRLGVHCSCKARSNCRNYVAFSGKCPEGKW